MRSNLKKLMVPMLLAGALVAGCGGEGDSVGTPVAAGAGSGGGVAPVEAPTIATSIDAVVAYLNQLIAGTSDSSDPISVNEITLATDDTASPSPLN